MDQANPLGGADKLVDQASSATPSIGLTTTEDRSWVIDSAKSGAAAGALSADPSQTQFAPRSLTGQVFDTAGASLEPTATAGSVTMSWTSASADVWSIAAAEFLLATGDAVVKETGVPLETVAGLAPERLTLLETLTSLTRERGLPDETLSGLSRARLPPLESLLGLTNDRAVPFESLFIVARTRLTPFETSIGLAPDARVLYEVIGQAPLILKETTVPLEALFELDRDAVAPLEAMGLTRVERVVPFEAMVREISVLLETIPALTRDLIVPFESEGQVIVPPLIIRLVETRHPLNAGLISTASPLLIRLLGG